MENIKSTNIRQSGTPVPVRRVIIIDSETKLPVPVSAFSGNAGGEAAAPIDTSALATGAKQDAQTATLQDVGAAATATRNAVTAGTAATEAVGGKVDGVGTKIEAGNAKLDTSTARLQEISAAIGKQDDATPASDTAVGTVVAFLKRIAASLTAGFSKLPASLGAKAGTASLSVTPATDALFSQAIRPTTTGPGLSTAKVLSSATTNATLVKTGATMLYAIEVSNKSAAPLLIRFYNKATAPVPGTDVPIRINRIPAGGLASTNRVHGMLYPLGLGYDIVTEAGAAVAANDVMGSLEYT